MRKIKQVEKINFDDVYIKKGYEKKYWPILNEYFARYQLEYGLNDEELAKKVDIVTGNLDSIVQEGEKDERTAGVYYSGEKKIAINSNKIRNLEDKTVIADVIFHELNHAGENMLNTKSTSFMSRMYVPEIDDDYIYNGIALNEIITEMKASRIAKDRKKQIDGTKHVLRLYGYSDLIFAGSMLHSAMGMSEIEFLKLTDRGRAGFDAEAIKLFSDPEIYELLIQSTEISTDTVYSIRYNRNSDNQYLEEEKMNMENSINNIYRCSLIAMSDVMAFQAFLNKDEINMEDYAKKWRYYLDKLDCNYAKGIQPVYSELSESDFQKALIGDVKTKILAIEAIGKSKEKLTSEEYSQMLSSLISDIPLGQKELTAIYKKCGMELTQTIEQIFKIKPDRETYKMLNEQNYGSGKWNNKKCVRYAAKAVKHQPIKEIVEAIKKRREIAKRKAMANSVKVLGPSLEPIGTKDNQEEFIPNENDLQTKLQNLVMTEEYENPKIYDDTLDRKNEIVEADLDRGIK